MVGEDKLKSPFSKHTLSLPRSATGKLSSPYSAVHSPDASSGLVAWTTEMGPLQKLSNQSEVRLVSL